MLAEAAQPAIPPAEPGDLSLYADPVWSDFTAAHAAPDAVPSLPADDRDHAPTVVSIAGVTRPATSLDARHAASGDGSAESSDAGHAASGIGPTDPVDGQQAAVGTWLAEAHHGSHAADGDGAPDRCRAGTAEGRMGGGSDASDERPERTGWVEPEWPLMVRVLAGNVDVVDRGGRAVAFERAKALELVVWLSQHRERSTRSGARTALWDLDVRDLGQRGLGCPPGDGAVGADHWRARVGGPHDQ
ncbi:MAG TPA: hypothetical protein PLV68_04445 [Ilumatobacteraceae bacterium]|nr:hypothetical protein [Ilumatobacteraceae bacterium]